MTRIKTFLKDIWKIALIGAILLFCIPKQKARATGAFFIELLQEYRVMTCVAQIPPSVPQREMR